MVDIEVRVTPTGDGWTCEVTIQDGPSETARGAPGTRHVVSVSRRELARFAPGETDPKTLVRRSFEFLLEHEPKESILRSFGLSDIVRYFPDYEAEAHRRLRG